MIQCFGPSVSIIVRYPGGISGNSWPIVRLHTMHGIPAPPQWPGILPVARAIPWFVWMVFTYPTRTPANLAF